MLENQNEDAPPEGNTFKNRIPAPIPGSVIHDLRQVF